MGFGLTPNPVGVRKTKDTAATHHSWQTPQQLQHAYPTDCGSVGYTRNGDMMAVQHKSGRAVSCELINPPGLPTGLESAHAQYYPHHRSDIRFTGDDLMAISKRLRFEILRRDNHCCRYCGEHASPQVKLTIDHVLPTALGGDDDPSNLAAACAPCNAGKSASSPDAPVVAQVAADAARWADAVRGAYLAALIQLDEADEYRGQVEHNWWTIQYDIGIPGGDHLDLPIDWEQSIDTFHQRGMPVDLLIKAERTALLNQRIRYDAKWKYFMGVAWKMLNEIEDDAKSVYAYTTAKADAG